MEIFSGLDEALMVTLHCSPALSYVLSSSVYHLIKACTYHRITLGASLIEIFGLSLSVGERLLST